jgi:hypothetical protein
MKICLGLPTTLLTMPICLIAKVGLSLMHIIACMASEVI